jgi:hypothetical protein
MARGGPLGHRNSVVNRTPNAHNSQTSSQHYPAPHYDSTRPPHVPALGLRITLTAEEVAARLRSSQGMRGDKRGGRHGRKSSVPPQDINTLWGTTEGVKDSLHPSIGNSANHSAHTPYHQRSSETNTPTQTSRNTFAQAPKHYQTDRRPPHYPGYANFSRYNDTEEKSRRDQDERHRR